LDKLNLAKFAQGDAVLGSANYCSSIATLKNEAHLKSGQK